MIDFLHPSFAKSLFLASNGAKMEPQWHLETIFAAIGNYVTKALLFREVLKTFLHLEATVGEWRVRPWTLDLDPSYIYIHVFYINLC